MTCDVWRRTEDGGTVVITGPVAGVPHSVSHHRYTHTLTPATGSEHTASWWLQPSQPHATLSLLYILQFTQNPTIPCYPDCSLASDIMEPLLHILWQVRRRWGWWHCCCGCHFKSRQQWSRWHVSLTGGWPGGPHWMVAASGWPHPGGAGWAPWGTPWWPGSPSRCCRTPWQTWWTSSSGASVPQVVQDIIKKFEKIVFLVFMCSGLNIYWAEGLNDKIAS